MPTLRLLMPINVKKALKFVLKGADAAHFEAIFDGLYVCVGASDLVQSIEHRVARRFGGGYFLGLPDVVSA